MKCSTLSPVPQQRVYETLKTKDKEVLTKYPERSSSVLGRSWVENMVAASLGSSRDSPMEEWQGNVYLAGAGEDSRTLNRTPLMTLATIAVLVTPWR